jgi:ribonuclease III
MDQQFLQALRQLNITPKSEDLYQTAFTHRSFLNESKEALVSNERLEFLGDSVLSLIVSSYLYQTRVGDAEGDLTNLRAFIVKTDSLAKASENLKLGQYLRLSKGEDVSGGRTNTQLLANTYEALLGAIFLDLGIDLAQSFVHQTLLPLFSKEVEQGAPKDAKSSLQEVAQSKFQQSPKYKILSTSGPDHAKKFLVGVLVNSEIVGQGEGSSKQQAEEQAAEQALLRLTQ